MRKAGNTTFPRWKAQQAFSTFTNEKRHRMTAAGTQGKRINIQ